MNNEYRVAPTVDDVSYDGHRGGGRQLNLRVRSTK
jgi:hypothetical protein